MTDTDPYAPFERCGWTIHRSQHYLTTEPDTVRISKNGYVEYWEAGDYDQFDGDDIAFRSLMDARLERALAAREAAARLDDGDDDEPEEES